MLVRMKTGCVEELCDAIGEQYIAQGRAERWPPVEKPLTAAEAAILYAEQIAGPAGTAGIEVATAEVKTQKAVLTFTRGPRSLRPRATTGG